MLQLSFLNSKKMTAAETSELFELKESDSRAVCVELSLLQCNVLGKLLALKESTS
jgi:hypothetical protein